MNSANPACTTYNLACLVSKFIQYLEVAIMLIISLAVVSFIWNVYRYFFSSDTGAEKKKEAGLYVMYSVLGFFIILSFWGLVAVLANTLNLPNAQPSWFFGGNSGLNTNTTYSPNNGSLGKPTYQSTTGATVQSPTGATFQSTTGGTQPYH
jgi:hypothetical protein